MLNFKKMIRLRFLLVLLAFFSLKAYAFEPLFESWISYDVGDYPFGIYAADLDGDLDADLAVANYQDNTVSILRNNGDGSFAPKTDYVTGTYPYSVIACDLDQDGDDDLVVPNSGYLVNTISVFKNNGDGTFLPKVDYPTGAYPYSVYASDFDKDGDLDVAVANNGSYTVSILKNSIACCNCSAWPLISSAVAASSSEAEAFCWVIWFICALPPSTRLLIGQDTK